MSSTFGPTANLYFVAASFLLFLLSLTHALWGEKKVFNKLNIPKRGHFSLYVPWHQMTYILFLSGAGIFLTALDKGFLPLSYVVLALNLGIMLVFTLVSFARKETGLIRESGLQYFLFALLIIA